jgi:Holliday junction DNA helicase RuvA
MEQLCLDSEHALPCRGGKCGKTRSYATFLATLSSLVGILGDAQWALVVQWIGRNLAEVVMWVRFPPRAIKSGAINCSGRERGALSVGIERFCGDPFSRTGCKIRAEKLLDATATRSVLGRFPFDELLRKRCHLLGNTRLHSSGRVVMNRAVFGRLIYCLEKLRQKCIGFFCIFCGDQFVGALDRVFHGALAACIKNAASKGGALCFLGRTCICHTLEHPTQSVLVLQHPFGSLSLITPSPYTSSMIGHLEGKIINVRGGFVILSAGGVGYKVAATRQTLSGLKSGEIASLWTHLAVREDVLDLYGFSEEETLRFFELLLSVSGIGPKSALAILDIADVSTLQHAIAAGNESYLTKVSGIGKKTAAKIVFELKEKIGATTEEGAKALGGDEDALEAMHALGYTIPQARDALRKVPSSIEKSTDRLREALKILGTR